MHRPFQKSQRGGNVDFYCGPVLQKGYGLGSILRSVARSVMPSLKEIGKFASLLVWKYCKMWQRARISKSNI